MAPFVGVGGEAVIFVAEVEQQVRVHVIGRAVHVGARGFARPRQRIHPALARHVGELALIVGAQRLHRLDRQLPHVGQAVGAVRLHQRRIDVPIAEVGQAEHPPAKLEVALEHRQTAVGLGDQRPVDASGMLPPSSDA